MSRFEEDQESALASADFDRFSYSDSTVRLLFNEVCALRAKGAVESDLHAWKASDLDGIAIRLIERELGGRVISDLLSHDTADKLSDVVARGYRTAEAIVRHSIERRQAKE